MKTTNLKLPSPRAWHELSTPTLATLAVFALLLFAAVVGRVQIIRQQAAAAPTPALVLVYVATPVPSPVPTPVPLPTPDERVYQELAALRAQVAQLQAAQQPDVVYVQAPPAEQPAYVEQAAPTPAMQPQAAALLDRNAWASTAATARAGR